MINKGALSFVALGTFVSCASAQYTEIDISGQTNADIQTYSNGSNYQVGGTQLLVGSVPFGLALLGGTLGTTGVVQTPATGGVTSYDFSIPDIAGTQIYTLINSAFGTMGTNLGQMRVVDSRGDLASMNLIEGVNVRDHNNDGFVNTLSDPTVVPTYFAGGVPNSTGGQVRLDMQTEILPSTFVGQTITQISFQGIGNIGTDGQPFLAGITIGAVPEPTTISLLGLGLVGVARRRKVARTR